MKRAAIVGAATGGPAAKQARRNVIAPRWRPVPAQAFPSLAELKTRVDHTGWAPEYPSAEPRNKRMMAVPGEEEGSGRPAYGIGFGDAPFRTGGRCVLQWMTRDQRMDDNWAAIECASVAIREHVPHVVAFCLLDGFKGAAKRQFDFMLDGLEEVSERCRDLGIAFHLVRGGGPKADPIDVKSSAPASSASGSSEAARGRGSGGDPGTVIAELAQSLGAGLVVCDFSPLRESISWRRSLRAGVDAEIPVVELDAHNVVPAWVTSGKLEYAARTIRRKVETFATPSTYASEFPDIAKLAARVPKGDAPAPAVDWSAVRASLEPCLDPSVPAVTWARGGRAAGMKHLSAFIAKGLYHYDKDRNDPAKAATSKISPWLHFGHVSAQRAVLMAKASHLPSASFVEEILVRRELSDNHCLYQPLYGTTAPAYPWAIASLRAHEADPREHIYTVEQFEAADTHDPLWNAGQLEMVRTGHMNGWVRMYWAKKILEWSPTVDDALATAIYLNDKYQLDGRDPNGYIGIAWSLIGTHDQGWSERKVFGKIRYMNFAGAKRKFNVDAYIQRSKQLEAEHRAASKKT